MRPGHITFIGSKRIGYTAERWTPEQGSESAHVRQGDDGRWTAWFFGNPYSIAHPECLKLDRGTVYQECTCPRVHVPGDFRTRGEAVQAAWDHKEETGEYVKRTEAQRAEIIRALYQARRAS